MRKRRVIVVIQRGAAWGEGPPEAQPGWHEHAAWIDALVDRGTIVLGGPFGDNTVRCSFSKVSAWRRWSLCSRPDPFVENGVLVVADVRE